MKKIFNLAISGLLLVLALLVLLQLPALIYRYDLFEVNRRLIDDLRLTESAARVDGKAVLSGRKMTALDLTKLMNKAGVWTAESPACVMIDGHATGLKSPTREEWAKIAEKASVAERVLLAGTLTLPSRVDHAVDPWFPPIGNQDGEGSCVAWAVGYYTKTFQEAIEHGWNLSGALWEGGYRGHPGVAYQDKIISPDFIYHLINFGADGGSSFDMAMELVCGVGACTWARMPYNPLDSTSWPSEEAWREAAWYRGNSTSGYEYMWLDSDDGVVSLKNWLASNHLAVIAVDGYKYSKMTSNDVWTLDNYASPAENHANTVVGYDDSFAYVEQNQTRYGAFKVANSWGVGGWEKVADGCYWVSYEAMKQKVGYCMFYQDLVNYQPEVFASFRIDHQIRDECQITVGMGDTVFPVRTKRLSDYVDGGNHPFCPNNIVFDITEFENSVPTVQNQTFFLRVYDGGTSATGTVYRFAVNYAESPDTPFGTVNAANVYARLTLYPAPRVRVVPDVVDLGAGNVTGQNFAVAVVLENVSNLYALDFQFRWDSTYLQCVAHTVTVPVESFPYAVAPSPYGGILHSPSNVGRDEVNETAATLSVACNSMFPAAGFDGNGTIVVVTFAVKRQSAVDVTVPLRFDWVTLEDDVYGSIACVATCGLVKIPKAFTDTSPPVVSILSPLSQTYSADDVALTFTVNEPTSWMGYSLDSQSNVTVTGNTTLAGVLDGAHALKVYAHDSAGNTGLSSRSFTVDTVPPSVEVLSPENKTYSTSSISLDFLVNETVYSLSYSLDSGSRVAIAHNTTLYYVVDGVHWVAVYANDSVGNMGVSRSVHFAVDTYPPSLTSVSQSPSRNMVWVGDEVCVNASVSDALSGLKAVFLNFTDGNGTWLTIGMVNVEGGVWQGTIPAFSSACYVTYFVEAEDNVGNSVMSEHVAYECQSIVPEFSGSILTALLMSLALFAAVAVKRIFPKRVQ